MAYLLNVIYCFALLAVAPWLAYQAVRKGKYRSGFAAKFLGLVPRRTTDQPCVWLHAVSVGEVNLLAPLIERLRGDYPGVECVVSTTTVAGLALAKTRLPDHTVFYCPLDFSWAVATAMRRIRPTVLVLVELEIWPNLIRAAKRRGAKVALINGRLSDRSCRGYRRLRPVFAGILRQFDLVAVQSETYASRFRRLGASVDSVHVTGSLKFDGAQTQRDNPATERLRRLFDIATDETILLAGSTQEEEDRMVLSSFHALSETHPKLRLILVPRHPHRFEQVAQMIQQTGLSWMRRSQLDHVPADRSARVLLVDTVGELGAWWGTADMAYVGGSMGVREGQNMIEPAAYGAAVSFGPRTKNFRHVAAALLDCQAAVVVHNIDDFTQFVAKMVAHPDQAAAMGQRAAALVRSQLGATQRTTVALGELFEGGHNAQSRLRPAA